MTRQFWLGLSLLNWDGTTSMGGCSVSSEMEEFVTHYNIPESEVHRWSEDLRKKNDLQKVVILSISPMFGQLK